MQMESAMKGTSGFQDVRSSTSRSPSYRYRLLHEQRHRFGTGAWHLTNIHAFITLFTGISAKQEKIHDTIFCFYGLISPAPEDLT